MLSTAMCGGPSGLTGAARSAGQPPGICLCCVFVHCTTRCIRYIHTRSVCTPGGRSSARSCDTATTSSSSTTSESVCNPCVLPIALCVCCSQSLCRTCAYRQHDIHTCTHRSRNVGGGGTAGCTTAPAVCMHGTFAFSCMLNHVLYGFI